MPNANKVKRIQQQILSHLSSLPKQPINNQMRKFIPPEFTWGKDHPDYESPTKKININTSLFFLVPDYKILTILSRQNIGYSQVGATEEKEISIVENIVFGGI